LKELVDKKDKTKNKTTFNLHWTIELGGTKNKIENKQRGVDLEQNSLKSRSGTIRHKTGFYDAAEIIINEKEMTKPEGYKFDFESKYKPLKDINFASVGEKCFMLMDKRLDITHSENKREKLAIADSGQFVLMEVNNSKKPGIKNIFFNSLIQIKSELDFKVKLQLESEYSDKSAYIDLASEELKYIPIRFCASDTVLTIYSANNERVTAVNEDNQTDPEIKFSSFFSDNPPFTPVTNYYFSGDSKAWDKITKEDITLTVLGSKPLSTEKPKVMITTSIYRKKIYVSNRGDQKEYAYAFLIALRPIIVIKNATPRYLELKFNGRDNLSQILEPNEKYLYKGNNLLDVKTSLRFRIVEPNSDDKTDGFNESSACYPFEQNFKKVKIDSVSMYHKKNKDNRLYLKIEIRRYSSIHTKCFVYCPFLIYNETDFNLYYKSRRLPITIRRLLH